MLKISKPPSVAKAICSPRRLESTQPIGEEPRPMVVDALPVSNSRPSREHYDVIIVGSGMGGGTLAFALKDAGISVLLLERGGFVPQEEQNWDPDAVFVQGRYKNAEDWYDVDGSPFSPGTYYYVGGNTKFYGSSLVRFRREDFRCTTHQDGESPAWPFDYEELAPHYRHAEQVFRCTVSSMIRHWIAATPFPSLVLVTNRQFKPQRRSCESSEGPVDHPPRRRSATGRFVHPLCNVRRLSVPNPRQVRRRRVLRAAGSRQWRRRTRHGRPHRPSADRPNG